MSIVTTTVTINVAFLEEIKEDDRQLRHLLSEFILSRPGSAYYRPSTAKRASQASTVAA